MIEALNEFFASGDVWSVVLKVLLTALLSGAVGLVITCIGRLLAKSKNSRIMKYAKICVEAAEQKFPNEGTKMGPQKMTYVMDQLAIKFPRIKENTYLYNIVESAVYELNREKRKQIEIEQFKEKYGEEPLAVKEELENTEIVESNDLTNIDNVIIEEPVLETVLETVVEQGQKLTSF